jgi:hypothetical protein
MPLGPSPQPAEHHARQYHAWQKSERQPKAPGSKIHEINRYTEAVGLSYGIRLGMHWADAGDVLLAGREPRPDPE